MCGSLLVSYIRTIYIHAATITELHINDCDAVSIPLSSLHTSFYSVGVVSATILGSVRVIILSSRFPSAPRPDPREEDETEARNEENIPAGHEALPLSGT
mmetsp:Transcript_20729/g.60290  ORF Transcript_20729/g.60290 Transcript_20729/m.60290 type:complete len:100 (+) Transcript_20729:277-576(+)